MKTDNLIQIKSYSLALRIVKLYRHLTDKKKEFVLSKQILRCGTSIGANVEEALGSQSRGDLAHSGKNSNNPKEKCCIIFNL
jgi:four helix bundle protein